MKMIGHEDEFMQEELVLGPVALKSVKEQSRHWLSAEDGSATPCNGGYEKRSDFLRRERHGFRG